MLMSLKQAKFQVLSNDVLPLSSEFIERLIEAYQAQERDRPSSLSSGGCWTDHGWQRNLAPLDEALAKGDAGRVMALLQLLFQTQCPYGIAMGKEELENIQSSVKAIELYEDQWMRTLLLLGEALGTIPVENPEVETPFRELNVSTILSNIEAALGIKVDFPQYFGAFGCAVNDTVIPRIAFFHILAAALCSRRMMGKSSACMVEVGGGFGGLLHFLSRLTTLNYTAFDVPAALVMQAAFTFIGSPHIAIQLYGEKLDVVAPYQARFLPSWTLLENSTSDPALPRLDLIINQDTLADIDVRESTQMLRKLIDVLDGSLISIGPDISFVSQKSAFQLRDMLTRQGLTFFDRAPFHVRPGYMQEIYRHMPLM